MAPFLPTHVEINNNKSGVGSIQVNAPIIGGSSAPESERARVRDELLAKIGPPNVEPRPAQGTCRWILGDDKFQSWRTGSDQHLLWISGCPGKGKSHLAAFVGEQLSHGTPDSSRSPLVVKFSCDNTDARRSTSLAVHLNVLYQILKFHRTDVALHDDASSVLNDIHTKLNSNLPREDLWEVIKGFINRDIGTTDGLTYLILDGLDECDAESIEDLSEKLQRLCSTDSRQGRPHFKAILLSRPLQSISNRDLWIDLDDDRKYGEQILHEIRVFIEDEMWSTLKTQRAELEKLKDILSERSNKTFLWVSLALKLLKSDEADLKAIVSSRDQDDALDRLLPVGLPSMYNRMLLEALQGKYFGQRNFEPKSCAKMLQFICVAFRPLTLTELQGAVDPSLRASGITDYCKHLLVQSIVENVGEPTEELFGNADEEFEYTDDEFEDTDDESEDTDDESGAIDDESEGIDDDYEDTEDEPNDESNEETFQLVHLSLKEYLQQPRRFTFPAPLGLLLWPYLSCSVDTLRTATHSFYYLDHILFIAIFFSLNGVLKSYPAVGFVLAALFARGLWNRWMQERSWVLQMILRVFERLLGHCVFGIFAASERSCHRDLFLRSLALLTDERSGLQRETMANLEKEGALSAKRPKSVDDELAPFGRYACRFWADHLYYLYEVDWTPREAMSYGKLVSKFLEEHLLDWVRSLSLHGNLRHSALTVRRLIRIFKNQQDGNPELEPFLKDAERFMMQFVPIIERAPFQIYGAALAFCPNKSTIRSTFRDRVLPFAKKIRAAHDDWSPLLQVLEGPRNYAGSVVFSKDGKLIASFHKEILLWDIETGRLERILKIENGELNYIAFSPRGQLIASGFQYTPDVSKRMIWVWDEKTGALVRSFHVGFYFGAIACSPDGNTLAVANGGSIQLWHLETGTFLKDISKENKYICSMAFSPDGYLIASMSDRIQIWHVETGQLEFTIVGDELPINDRQHPGQKARLDSLAFSANTVSDSGHGTLQLWDPEIRKMSKALLKHCAADSAVAFSPDGTMLAAGYYSNVCLWDSKSCSLPSEQLPGVRDNGGGVKSMVISSDKQTLVTLSEDELMNIWGLEAGTAISLGAQFSGVSTFTFSPQRDLLAFASFVDGNNTVRLWSLAERKEAHVLDQPGDKVMKLCLSSDGSTLAFFSEHCVRLLNPATGTTRHVLELPTSTSLCLSSQFGGIDLFSFCPKTESVAFPTGQEKEQAIEIWHPASASGSRVQLEGFTGEIDWTSFSPDGTKIAISYFNRKTIPVWDTATGQLDAKIERSSGIRAAMGFSPDNSLLMISEIGRPVKIWKLGEGTCTDAVRATDTFDKLALSDCGNYLVTERGLVGIGHNGSRRAFYVDDEWVVRGQEKILWLPPDMRAKAAILVNDLLILGCVSGRVELIQFCEQEEQGRSN